METFVERHEQIDPDPVVELERRLQLWASAPDSDGQPLRAQIVPVSTIHSALAELREWRKIGEAIAAKKMTKQ